MNLPTSKNTKSQMGINTGKCYFCKEKLLYPGAYMALMGKKNGEIFRLGASHLECYEKNSSDDNNEKLINRFLITTSKHNE